MFGRLYSVCRCLGVVLFPRMVLLVLLCVLYCAVEYNYTTWYFGVYGHVWQPAFPWSWRLLLLLLCAVPAFSFLHLLWLWVLPRRCWRRRYNRHSNSAQGYVMLPRSESNSEERERSGARDDEDRDSEDIEGNASSPRPHAPLQNQAPRRLFSSDRFIHIMFWFAILCTSLWVGLHYQHPGDVRYLSLIKNANAHPNRAGHANQEKIYIAALFFNNEQILPYWSDSLIKAIHYLGEDNVFVSIIESGSVDRSPVLLQQLDDRLDAMDVSRRILIHDKAVRPDDPSDHARVYFLSDLRNRVLEPLVETGGYDKVIFSNDIYIEPETIIELINTADGEYDMACGMDFGNWGLYDMWVLRDRQGRLGSSIWPYFFDIVDYQAMQTESPVPVFTCWNGIVVFKADPVLPIHLRSNRTLSTDPLPFELPATHPVANDPSLRGPNPALTPPTRFRASAPGECFSSESFLLPYDFRRAFNMQRIFINPRVIVAYDWRFYRYFKWILRHPVLKWWIERMYDGAWMQKDVLVVGDGRKVSHWDGGDCHPWTE